MANQVDSVKLAALIANLEGGTVADPEALQALMEDFTSKYNSAATEVNGKASKTQEAWIAPTLLNGWVNYGAPFANVGYYKDEMGRVHLRGAIKSGTTTPGTQLFTLPPGYRIASQDKFSVASNNGTNEILGTVNVQADLVTIVSGSNVLLSLAGISFRADS